MFQNQGPLGSLTLHESKNHVIYAHINVNIMGPGNKYGSYVI